MTGFGSAEGEVQGGRLSIEIRTVNHRYYNPQFKLPFELGGIEGTLRERLRQLLDRGHVAVSARWLQPPAGEAGVKVDFVRARQVVAAAKELKKRLKLKGDLDLAFVARQPDVLNEQSDGAGAVAWSDVEPIVERAAQDVLAMRAREGRALAAELAARLDGLDAGARAIEQRAPERLSAELARLKKDVAEGKQLGFLGQELLREVNTIGSKANDVAITQTVIAMKGELEKFREQLENLE